MQTFLWHPLTPKCTCLSQNKSKKTLRKYWENFFRNYALFYMQGVGIFTEITVQPKHQPVEEPAQDEHAKVGKIVLLLRKYFCLRSNFSLLVLDGMLSAVGGFTRSYTTASMEVLHNRVWLHRPDHDWLPAPR